MRKKQVLVIEAHSDDSVISIGGFLEKNRETADYHFLLMAASDMTLAHYGFLSRAERLSEYETYVSHFKGTWHRNANIPFDYDCRLDTLPKREIVKEIEQVIAEVQPDVLIFQGPSFHHDHTIVYEAVIAATRPTSRFFPREMYIMENPTYVHSTSVQITVKPNVYCSLSADDLQKKLVCYRQCFPSQIRQNSNYLSEEGLKSWARYRGIEARCEFAEALTVFIQVI